MKQTRIIIRNMAVQLRKEMRQIIRKAVKKASIRPTGDRFNDSVQALYEGIIREFNAVFDSFDKRRRVLEPLFSMPPARRVRKTRKPLTLVERRAVVAKGKLSQWKRKQKLAATKVRAYKRKVGYYTKKGAI
jgi:hypothetical protein